MYYCVFNFPPGVPGLDDQVVGFIVFVGIFGLCYCTETPGLYGDALCKLLYFIAIVLCVDTECWVCDL